MKDVKSTKPVVKEKPAKPQPVNPVEPIEQEFYEPYRRYTYSIPEIYHEKLDTTLEEERGLYNLVNRYCIETQSETKVFPSFYDLCLVLTGWRNGPSACPVTKKGSCVVQRGTLRRVAQSFQDYRRNLKNGKACRRPRPKSREEFRSIVIGDNTKTKVKGNWLFILKLGWFYIRRNGRNPYPQGIPCLVTLTRKHGKWYASISFKVQAPVPVDNEKILGVDRNVGQVTDSEGRIYPVPSTKKEETKTARLQRKAAKGQKGSDRRKRLYKMAGKHKSKSANIRRNHNHHVSKIIANMAGIIILEDLNTQGMMASARGTMENPGKNVKQKTGLNRGIQGSNWYQLEKMIEYKAHKVLYVKPAYTSQTCYVCGHRSEKSRKSQAIFECVECGHSPNADVNAALNIRRMGLTQLHGEKRSRERLLRPVNKNI